MKVVNEIPEIYKRIKQHFNVDWERGVIITYGDTVYSKFPLTPDLEVHEAVHVEQQTKIGAEKWWDLYFQSPEFRLMQELEAYHAQLEYSDAHYDRGLRRRLQKHVYWSMHKMYAGMVKSEEHAKELLQNYKNLKLYGSKDKVRDNKEGGHVGSDEVSGRVEEGSSPAHATE